MLRRPIGDGAGPVWAIPPIGVAIMEINIGKGAGTMEVDVAALKAMPAVSDYVWLYGLKQMLSDAHSAVTAKTDPDEEVRRGKKRALAEKKLASLMAGEVAATRTATSPVEREMRAMAIEDLRPKLAAVGVTVKSLAKDRWEAIIERQIAANEEAYREAAIRKLAIKPVVADSVEDIMALLAGETTPEDIIAREEELEAAGYNREAGESPADDDGAKLEAYRAAQAGEQSAE